MSGPPLEGSWLFPSESLLSRMCLLAGTGLGSVSGGQDWARLGVSGVLEAVRSGTPRGVYHHSLSLILQDSFCHLDAGVLRDWQVVGGEVGMSA